MDEGRSDNRIRLIAEVLLIWVLWLGIDFLAHGAIFASLYRHESSFLLADQQLFARIPLGYTAFLMYCAMTAWLIRVLNLHTSREATIAGFALGSVISIAGILALLSISKIGLALAAAWTGTQIVEFSAAGFVAAALWHRASLRRPTAWIASITLILLILGVVIQNLFGAE